MNTTIGSLCDQLSIINIKIYFLENLKRDESATDKQIADATRKTNILNVQRNQLISAIDEAINDVADGKKINITGQNFKLYGKK